MIPVLAVCMHGPVFDAHSASRWLELYRSDSAKADGDGIMVCYDVIRVRYISLYEHCVFWWRTITITGPLNC